MLNIFAGTPACGLNAGGLRYLIQTEGLAELEEDPLIQYRKKGVFAAGTDELLYPVEVVLSPSLEPQGITWDWFRETTKFGNGVTIGQSTHASPEYKTVVCGTDLSWDEFLKVNGPTSRGSVIEECKDMQTESWKKYEARWLPGTCPQEPHIVRLSWIVTTHKLPNHAYTRLQNLIEFGAEAEHSEMYVCPDEPGKYLSEQEIWGGKLPYEESNAFQSLSH